jgi:NAD(P)-dependent dehydrogenase (short-subunit alcohol dehydrogenase family)
MTASPVADLMPRAALVTGAAQRIGGAIVRGLAADGWAVAVHYRNSRQAAEALVGDITATGGRAVALPADLAVEEEVEALVPRAVAALGPLGCLVNNASHFVNDTARSATRASWDAHLATNLRAPFVLIQQFASQLAEPRRGVVVNLLDQRVWNLTPYFVSYTVSKTALWTLTQTMALALAPRIRVNAIGPGPTVPSPRQTAEQFARQNAELPLGRGTTPEEIAAAVRFILATPALTGQMIALDGGQHLGWAQATGRPPPEE